MKKLRGFSFSKNMANFEAFCWTINLEHKPLISEEYTKNQDHAVFAWSPIFDNI